MDGDQVKKRLRSDLQEAREALVWKLEGLSEYEIRRPLTATGTNLLGLVKHSAVWESRYFGEVFDRPFPEPLARWDDREAQGRDLWATEHETREKIVALYQRVWAHADATVLELPLDAPGRVPWWRHPDVVLFDILLHLLTETNRHAGHADILREQLDGRTGMFAGRQEPIDTAAREARRSQIEAAARHFERR